MYLPPPNPVAITIQAPAPDMEYAKITRELVTIASDVARATFPGSRCDGKIVLNLNVPASQMYGGVGDSVAADGLAFPGTCRIDMATMGDPTSFCGTYVHEYGHHALTETEADHENPIAGGIMAIGEDSVVWNYGPCRRALAAYNRRIREREDYRANAGYRRQERAARKAEKRAAKARARAKARIAARRRAAARR